jgi:hypothetical protein
VDTFGSFAAKLDKLNAQLESDQLREISRLVGVDAQADAAKAVQSDLGKDHFSGWPQARFSTRVRVVATGVEVLPDGKGRGPWYVAQRGRHPGMSGPRQGPALAGFTKTGKQRKTRGKKWNGTTRPMHTWDEAMAIIDRETPARVDKLFSERLGKIFG